jgi:hypothetical protein
MDHDTLAPLERFVISWESMSWDYRQVPDIVVDSLIAWFERSNFVQDKVNDVQCSCWGSSTQNLQMVLFIVPWTAKCESLEGTKGCPHTMWCEQLHALHCPNTCAAARAAHVSMPTTEHDTIIHNQYLHVLNVDPAKPIDKQLHAS